jgi:hypothetical protein
VFSRVCAFQSAKTIVDGFEREAVELQTLGEQFAQFDVIIDDKKSLHHNNSQVLMPIVAQESAVASRLYKTLSR